MEKKLQVAVFAAGCFWHVQHTFDCIPEITSTKVGYIGGKGIPDYYTAEENGFAEAIEVRFNSKNISYEKILEIFWKDHDPTSLNRQRNDSGKRYRSAIFYHNENQRKIAEKSLKNEQKKYSKKIVTDILPAETFFPAEEKHQKYFEKQGVTCKK